MSGRRQVAVAENRVPPLAALPRPPMQDSAFDDLYERSGVAIPHFVTAENLRQFHLWNWFVTGRVVDAWQKARDLTTEVFESARHISPQARSARIDDFGVHLLPDHLVDRRGRVPGVVVIRGRFGAGSGVFVENRSPGAGVLGVLDPIVGRAPKHFVEELSPMTEADLCAGQFGLDFAWDSLQLGIEALTNFTKGGNGGGSRARRKRRAPRSYSLRICPLRLASVSALESRRSLSPPARKKRV